MNGWTRVQNPHVSQKARAPSASLKAGYGAPTPANEDGPNGGRGRPPLHVRGRRMFVMIAKDLLEMLVCPACLKALEYRESPESLKCLKCHRVYSVEDDIPNMVIEDAKIEA